MNYSNLSKNHDTKMQSESTVCSLYCASGMESMDYLYNSTVEGLIGFIHDNELRIRSYSVLLKKN